MKKRILSLLVMLSILSSVFIMPQAAVNNTVSKEYISEAAGLLLELGIIFEVPDSEKGERELSRADFITYAAKAIGIEENTDVKDRYFTDIPMDHWAAGYINSMVELNIISLPYDKLFRPNDKITQNEALKILLCMCGYGDYALVVGGYPNGFTEVASKLEFTLLGSNKALTLNEAIVMIYDALCVPMFDKSAGGGSQLIYSESDDTLLSRYFDIYMAEGLVTQSTGISLYGDTVKGKTSAETARIVKIADEEYVTDISFYDYLGRNTFVFYKQESELDTPEIIYRAPYKKSDEVKEINADDLVGYENGILSYYDKNSRIEKEEISQKAIIIKNGQYENSNNNAAFDMAKGNIRLIDTEYDGEIDFVIISEYSNIVVSIVDKTNFIVYDDVIPSRTVNLDENKKTVFIESATGAKRSFFDIAAGQVLTVYSSDEYTRVIINADGISSHVYGVKQDDEGYFIELGKSESDRKWYKVDEDYYREYFSDAVNTGKIQVSAGADVTYYLDAFGNIAYITGLTPDGWIFAYLVDTVLDSDYDVTRVKAYTQNKEFKFYELSDRVTVDGSLCRDYATLQSKLSKTAHGKTLKKDAADNVIEDDINGQLIRLKINQNGLVIGIDTEYFNTESESRLSLHRTDERQNLRYWYYLKSFANGKFLFDSNTVHFSVPDHQDLKNASEKDFYILSGSYAAGAYDVEGFKLDEYAGNESAIVIYSGDSESKKQGPYLVDSVYEAVGDDGDIVLQARLCSALSGDMITINAETDEAFTFTDGDLKDRIAKGDLIFIYVENRGDVGSIQMLCDYSRRNDETYNMNTGWKTTSGPLQSETYHLLYSYIKSRDNDVVRLKYSSKPTVEDYKPGNVLRADYTTRIDNGSVLIFDGRNIEEGTTADLISAEASGVENANAYWLIVQYARVKAAVIYTD